MLTYALQRIVCAYMSVPTLITLREIPCYERIALETLKRHNPLTVICMHLYPKGSFSSFDIETSLHITPELFDKYVHVDGDTFTSASRNPALTPDIIRKYKDSFFWPEGDEEDIGMSGNPALVGQGTHPLTQEEVFDLIDYCEDEIDWECFSQHQKLTDPSMFPIVDRYVDDIDWKAFAQYQKLTIPALERYKDYLEFSEMEYNDHLTEEIIEHFADRFRWRRLLTRENVTREFIIRNYYRVFDWREFSSFCLGKFPDLIVEYRWWPWKF